MVDMTFKKADGDTLKMLRVESNRRESGNISEI
jgi:hypothetical protein